MAEEPIRDEHDRQQAVNVDLFRGLADAYSFVHGQEQVRALASTTFGQILQSRIDEIRGPHPQGLPSRIEEVDSVKAEFDRIIAQLEQDEEENP